ncbi:MAG: prepilin-type N-terminal cleavage/methylation domain-containing protein [Candidatus Gracilibacteria bacterium]|nr:prepilin-type N-terminal cleavage/methylation domain-containing protein [Candidatus Gracilibacteria bacterium]
MNKQKQAFTLVELIVVITILAILATIAFISLSGYSQDARNSIRAADIKTIEKALQVYATRNSIYPAPESAQTVSYSGDTVYYQGTFGDSPYKILANLSNIPLDPLTKEEYIYSTTANYTQYEILAIYEGEIVYNTILNQAQAAETYKPKVNGTYNKIYVKTQNYYIPLPSLINSEVTNTGITLNSTNIKSQIITNGNNLPRVGTTITQSTGAISNLNLSPYTGTITSTSTDEQKIELAQKIQQAYSGSDLQTQSTYANIINKPTNQLVALIDSIVLGQSANMVSSGGGTVQTKKSVSDCGNTSGQIIYGTIDGTDTNLTCDDDIIVCNGTTGSGYTISACNLGATTASTDWTVSAGLYFQWGNNYGSVSNGPTTSTLADATGYGPGNYYSSMSFILGSSSYNYDWTTVENDNLWGDNSGAGTDEQRQGPCVTGYHVPSKIEWSGIVTAGQWGTNGANMQIDLKLPYAGRRSWDSGTFNYGSSNGIYWSSSPKFRGNEGYNLYFDSSSINPSSGFIRAFGFSVRCFKNY